MLIYFTRTAMGLTLHSWLGLQSHKTSITQNMANYGLCSISRRRPFPQLKWHVTHDELVNVETLSLLLTYLPPSLPPCHHSLDYCGVAVCFEYFRAWTIQSAETIHAICLPICFAYRNVPFSFPYLRLQRNPLHTEMLPQYQAVDTVQGYDWRLQRFQ